MALFSQTDSDVITILLYIIYCTMYYTLYIALPNRVFPITLYIALHNNYIYSPRDHKYSRMKISIMIYNYSHTLTYVTYKRLGYTNKK